MHKKKLLPKHRPKQLQRKLKDRDKLPMLRLKQRKKEKKLKKQQDQQKKNVSRLKKQNGNLKKPEKTTKVNRESWN